MNYNKKLTVINIKHEELITSSLENSRSNPQKGIDLADEALKLSSVGSHEVAQALVCKGACQVWLGDYESGLKNLFEPLQLLESYNDSKFQTHTIYHIFCAFYFLGDYDNALKYAYELLNKAEKFNDLPSQANAFNGIGSVYYTSGDNEKAIEILSKGLIIAQDLLDKHILARILDGLGTAYFNLKNIEKSIEFKERSLETSRSIGLKNTESFALDGLAQIYLATNDFVKAENYFKQSLSIREEINFNYGISETNLYLGNLYLQLETLDKAKSHLTVALDIANESNSKEIIYKTHEAFSKLYEKQMNNEKFIEHFKKYFTYKEEFFSEKNKQKLSAVEMQFNISQIEKEKELLGQKNKQLELLSNDLVVLSDLGKTIISQLSIESINTTVYTIISNLMDAKGFGIGVITDDNAKLTFPGYIENDVVLGSTSYSLTDNNRLAVVCYNQDRDIIISDPEKEISQYIQVKLKPTIGEDVQSIIYLPLKLSDRKVGVLTVQSFVKNAFTEYHFNLVKNLAVYCAIAIENATLYEKLEERILDRTKEVILQKEAIERAQENSRLLNDIGQQIISSFSFESIFAKLHENVSKLMNADCFSIRVYDSEKQEIDYRYSYEKGKLLNPVTVSMNNIDNYSVWCVANKQEIFINDNSNEFKKYTSKIVVPRGEMPSSLLFCPLMIGEKITGVITVQSFQKNAYVPSDMNILKTLGTYTAIALENANLVDGLEVIVNERTSEVVEQKDQIEKSFRNTELIGEIGKEIAATFSVDEIISKVYQQINTLIDATIFGIGLYRSEYEDVFFSGAFEKGKILDPFYYKLNDDKPAAHCFNQAKEFVINDLETAIINSKSYTYDAVVGDLPESMVYMPLFSKGKTIGVITVQSFEKNKYKDYHVDILRNLSVYVGSAIENANLYKGLEEKVNERTKEVILQKEEIEKSHENTRLLSEMGQQIISSVNFNAIFKNLHENVCRLMNADCFGVRIYHPTTNQIEYRYEMENGVEQDTLMVSMDNIDNFSVWCVTNKTEIFINDNLNEYQKYTSKIVVPTGDMPNSLIFCPMMIGEKIVGVITVQSFEKFAYKPLHVDFLKTLGTYTAIALENANLVENLEDKVKERTSEVVKQKEIIEESNKHITDSIKYAKRIQDAFLPSEQSISEHFKNSFILYKPKDIVSGDFYWFERKGNKILFAVVDCTGHGVPGAFMSIIGFNGLNQIVNEYNYTRPSDILTYLNKSISNTLRQTVEDTKIRDGMDVAICSIDLDTNKLEFAGAFSPLFIIRNDEVIKFKGDKHPIGNYINEEEYVFTNNEIDLFPEDRIYIFSDGFVDQFGGPNGKKLKYDYFRKLLLDNHKKPMSKQKEDINIFFEEWRNGYEQIDDVCIIGVAI